MAQLVEGRRYDEALGGAAAGVALAALQGEAVDDATVRWKSILAGYPLAVRGRAVASAPFGEVPEDIRVALGLAPPNRDLGLVRARGPSDDLWVLLVGGERGDLPPFPREIAPGEALALAPGLRWRVAAPDGSVADATGAPRMDQLGEWLVRGTDDEGVVVNVPVHVGVTTPPTPPVHDVVGLERLELAAAARRLVDDARARYGHPPADDDPALASLARSRLRVELAGGQAPSFEHLLRVGGFVRGRVAGSSCRAVDVRACVEAMWWSVDGRAVLVAPFGSVGVAASPVEGGVVVVALAADG